MTEELHRARGAAARGDWADALARYARVPGAELTPADLETIADAYWWSCRIDDAIAARRRAYDAHLAAGDRRRAGHAAWLISLDHGVKSETAVGSGWLQLAQRHLADEPDSVERGFLAITESDLARDAGDVDEAVARAELAVALGERCGSADLRAMGIQTLGRTLLAAGRARDGLRLLDEAMAMVMAGGITPLYTGFVYCNVLAACMAQADLGRAAEWTDAAVDWCESISALTPYHGICRLHRVEVAAWRGEWTRAESEALRTVEELHGLEQHIIAEAMYNLGEIYLRRGDLDAAEGWFARASELGRDPHPGLARVRLAQHRVDAAAAALRVSLASFPEPTLRRARLLAAQADVAVAAGDAGTARAAAAALEDVAATATGEIFEAMAAHARASVHLLDEEIDAALTVAHRAWSLWNRLKLPYDAARTRTVAALAAARAGDTERAQAEMEAARSTFEQLGATLDARTLGDLMNRSTEFPRGLSNREVEVLRLVAEGKTDREIAQAMVISEHTVSRHLQNIYRKLEVSSRAAATAFAFEHGLVSPMVRTHHPPRRAR